MKAHCQFVGQCPLPTTPGVGYVAETFAAPTFVAVATGPNQPPPLGWAFENPVVTANGESDVSQEEAQEAAWHSATAQAQTGWTSPEVVEWPNPVQPITMDFNDEWPVEEIEPIY
jgi:hypothetical protein